MTAEKPNNVIILEWDDASCPLALAQLVIDYAKRVKRQATTTNDTTPLTTEDREHLITRLIDDHVTEKVTATVRAWRRLRAKGHTEASVQCEGWLVTPGSMIGRLRNAAVGVFPGFKIGISGLARDDEPWRPEHRYRLTAHWNPI
jgi:hypothetical protein